MDLIDNSLLTPFKVDTQAFRIAIEENPILYFHKFWEYKKLLEIANAFKDSLNCKSILTEYMCCNLYCNSVLLIESILTDCEKGAQLANKKLICALDFSLV